MIKLASLYSGGKDSNYALVKALEIDGYDVNVLLAMKSENKFGNMFHYPDIEITKIQAELLDLPIEFGKTKGEKEKELKDLKEIMQYAHESYSATGFVAGAVYSVYQKSRIDRLAYELGLKSYAPSWLTPEREYIEELKQKGFKIIVTRVSAYGISKSFLGKSLFDMLEKAKYINLVGEGGEYETLVTYQPFFRGEIVIKRYEVIDLDEYSADLLIKDIDVIPKKRIGKKNILENPLDLIKKGKSKYLLLNPIKDKFSTYEYIFPIYRVTNAFITNLKKLNSLDLEQFEKIIIPSFPWWELDKDIDFDELLEIGKEIIVVGNSAYEFAKYLGLKTVDDIEFGLRKTTINGREFNVYYGNYLGIKETTRVKTLAKSSSVVTAFQYKNIKAYFFKPEYLAIVRNYNLF